MQRTGVDECHAAHGTACVVEHPLFVVRGVGVDGAAVGGEELGDDELGDTLSIVSVCGDGALGEGVQLLVVEDVEGLEVLLEEDVDGHEDAEDGSEEHDPAAQAVAAAWGRHCGDGGVVCLRADCEGTKEKKECQSVVRSVMVPIDLLAAEGTTAESWL